MSKCKGCIAIQDALKELCIVHETIVVENPTELPYELRKIGEMPILVDEDNVICGEKNVLVHLEKLAKFKELWYKYQSDACYCNDDEDIQ